MSTFDHSVRRPATRARVLAALLAVALVVGLLAALPATRASAATCPCTVFGTAAPTGTTLDNGTAPVELGMKFRSDTAGAVTGVRFYKQSVNSGIHVGSLWGPGGKLASVTFASETTSGWQQANFSAPVQIQANTTYVVSYFSPTGKYTYKSGGFNAAVANAPLTGLASGDDGANGVYRYTSTASQAVPDSSWNNANYYVDVVFTPGADTTAPTVASTSPAANASGVATNSAVSATFSEPVQSSTVAMTLKAGTTTVNGTTSYNTATNTATLSPAAALSASTTYTASVTGAKDTAGNTMSGTTTWTFTTGAATSNACPCSVFAASAVPSVTAANDNSAVELGMRFRSSQAGFVTGVKFYKGSGNTGTHRGSLWNAAGTQQLATVNFTNETASGWQTATFGAPVPISANTTYVVSYYAPVGRYAVNNNGFNTATTSGPLTGLASGTDGLNGLYVYGGSAFPEKSYQKSNYWVDVVFNTTANDTVAPTLTSQVPAPGSSGAAVAVQPSASFSEPVSNAVIELRDAANAVVAGTPSYDAGAQKLTFTPSAPLATSSTYTVNVSGAKDAANNTMTPVSWTFTSAAPAPPGPEKGPGGPIAVVTSPSNPYATFLAEILRTEGLNEFATIDSSTLSATTLASYDTVVLGAVPVTAAQADVLSTWVTGGGNLIALKPSSTLASLAGITAASGTLSDAYLKINTATAPGAGIVADSIQFHGTADRYTANSGTQTVAALWSNATTATTNPAQTLRSVGTQGGQVSTFSFDLAKSVALSRQGNPAWAGTERDGNGTIRSDDLYFGGSVTDWVNLNKVAIPQADELQRLLANTIQLVNRDKKPLPRFWYFPKNHKAVLVGTGDDHARNGTTGRFNQMIANSPANCSVTEWTCYRYSSYIWNGTPLTNAAAANFTNQGFEVGLHVNTGGGNYTSDSIFDIYAEQMAEFKSKYTTYPNPATTRMHAIVWSDWVSQAKAEIANGMRMDTNYYYWPGTWVQDRPGFMTGSGMAMRFTDVDGSLVDNYQAATQMTDESNQTYPATLNTLVGNALNANGFYGSFVTNFHTDDATQPESNALISVAQANNVPIISSQQLLTWLDGRNASSYSDLVWNNSQLSFKVNVGAGANNLTGMLPTAGPNGSTLSGLTRAGSAVVFTTSTVKGLEYASFPAGSGSYVATYSGGSAAATGADVTDTVPGVSSQNARTLAPATSAARVAEVGVSAPKVSKASVAQVTAVRGIRTPTVPTTADAKTLSWTTKKNATTQVLLGTSPTKLTSAYNVGETSREHTATIPKLKPKTTYYYRVVSTDTTGVTAVSPAASAEPASFTTAAVDLEAPVISVAPEVVALPDGTALVSWTTGEATSSVVRTGESATSVTEPLTGEAASTEHSLLLTDLEPGKTYYFATDSVDASGNKTTTATTKFVTPGFGVAQAAAPTFKMGKGTGSITVLRKGQGRVTLSGKLGLAQSGTFTSAPMDAGQMVDWTKAIAKFEKPTGTTIVGSYRVGSTTDPDDGTWSSWASVDNGKVITGSGRYLQFKVEMTATAKALGMPAVWGIGFTHTGKKLVHPGETGPR